MQTPLSKGRNTTAAHKVTIRLSAEAWAATAEAVDLGLAANRTAFIEEAIRRQARETKRARLRKLAAEAMADPGFVDDMRRTMADFDRADLDSWPEPLDARERTRKVRPRKGSR